MQILLTAGAYNSMTQRVHAELAQRGHEVAVAVRRFAEGTCRPGPLDYSRLGVPGRCRPPCRQQDRRIDWPAEPTCSVLAKLRAADSSPGALDVIGGTEYYLVGSQEEDERRGEPGTILAYRDGAICRAGAPGVYEMTWAPDGRTTWQYGPGQRPGVTHVIWRRAGTHAIFDPGPLDPRPH